MTDTATKPQETAQPQGQQQYLTPAQQKAIISRGNPPIDNNVVKGYN